MKKFSLSKLLKTVGGYIVNLTQPNQSQKPSYIFLPVKVKPNIYDIPNKNK